MSLKNKKILITAGPTWVPIDKVRVISNISTGQTGIMLAEEALRQGAKVTLFLGPVSACCLHKSIRLVRFVFFEELKNRMIIELKSGRYDLIIHSAAVSDFKPREKARGKISSRRGLRLELVALPKIIASIRRFSRGARVVIFKLESGVSTTTLLQRAIAAGNKNKADLVVANQLGPYRAFIIGKEGVIAKVREKRELARQLFKILRQVG